MSRYRRARVAGGCYFFTLVTERRQRILTDEPVRVALRAAIERIRESVVAIAAEGWRFGFNDWLALVMRD